jgi:mono/diheme cytochrome c family protein
MKRILKWVGIALGGIIGLVVIVVLAAFGLATSSLNKTYDISVESIPIPTDAASIERGQYLATAMSTCIGCHGPDLAGTFLLDDPGIGQIFSANLTSGQGGKGATYTDEDWVRALRHGVNPDGKAAMVMPSQYYSQLNDADLGALIAYLKSVPPVDRESPPPKLTFMAKVLFGLGQFGKMPTEIILERGPANEFPEPGVSVEYGDYVAHVSGCQDCHGVDFAGGIAGGPGGPPAPNLTPGGQLVVWTEADFIQAFRSGATPQGQMDTIIMPIAEYQMTDDDLKALFMYLKSLEAIQPKQ